MITWATGAVRPCPVLEKFGTGEMDDVVSEDSRTILQDKDTLMNAIQVRRFCFCSSELCVLFNPLEKETSAPMLGVY